MHWIAPSEKDTDNAALEKCLWDIRHGGQVSSHYDDPHDDGRTTDSLAFRQGKLDHANP
jgi:hypothetical protein